MTLQLHKDMYNITNFGMAVLIPVMSLSIPIVNRNIFRNLTSLSELTDHLVNANACLLFKYLTPECLLDILVISQAHVLE